MLSPSQLFRQLLGLLDLCIVRWPRGIYRCYLTNDERAAIAAGERLTAAVIVPAMI
jgi:hypothetical protein